MPWGVVRTSWGEFLARWGAGGLEELRFPGRGRLPGRPTRSRLLAELERELAAYFAGELSQFTVPLALTGTEFQLQVWEALRGVRYGTTVTYGELARAVGRPGAARAVGRAVGANPIPIVIPCHRVVGARGLGGFGPGQEWKRRLLALEGAQVGG